MGKLETRLNRPFAFPVEGLSKKLYGKLISDFYLLAGDKGNEEGIVTTFRRIVETLPDDAVFWDIGSHIGQYTAHFSEARPNGVFRSFEPDPTNLEILRLNYRKWNWPIEWLQPYALSDTDGTEEFFLDGGSGCTSALGSGEEFFVSQYYGRKPKAIQMRTARIDTLIAEGIPTPHLIKLDVEGAEDKVFIGAVDLLLNDSPVIIFESNTKGALCKEFLEQKRYRVFDADQIGEVNADSLNFLAIDLEKHSPVLGPVLSKLGYMI